MSAPALAKLRMAHPEQVLAAAESPVIVEFKHPGIVTTKGLRATAAQLGTLSAELANKKRGLFGNLARTRVLADYSHLPYAFVSVPRSELAQLLEHPDVAAVHENEVHYPYDAETFPVTRQTEVVAETPLRGDGYTVAIIDTGVDFTQPDFGTCTAAANGWQPKVSNSCRVKASLDFADNDGIADNDGKTHGTNVSGIAAGMAPKADLVVLDVFTANDVNGDGIIQHSEHSAKSADELKALNWVIANQATYNIVAVNMSLGGVQDLDGDNSGGSVGDVDGNGIGDIGYTTGNCPTTLNSAFSQLLSNGVVTVVSSGNDGLVGTVASPGCDPNVITVGNQFAEDLGVNRQFNNMLNVNLGIDPVTHKTNGFDVGMCTNNNPQNQQIACSSNTSADVEVVAPGINVTAGGVTLNGTSMSAPHVTGAIAVLAEASGGSTAGSQLRSDVLATTATASDPKAGANYKLPQLDVVQSVIAASPWTPVIESLPAAQWYSPLNEGLLLSALGLAHELYGSGIKHDTMPINQRVASPLIMVAVR